MSLLLVGCARATGPVIATPKPHSPVCPSSLAGVHSGSRLSQLAPSTPDRAVFCKYAGMNEKVKSGTLVRIVGVQNPSALAALLNQAKPVPKDAAFSCPFDSANRDALVFVKAIKTTTVIIPTSGCRMATSTNTSGAWFLSRAAASELQKLDPVFRP
jgi:hypothetical protein